MGTPTTSGSRGTTILVLLCAATVGAAALLYGCAPELTLIDSPDAGGTGGGTTGSAASSASGGAMSSAVGSGGSAGQGGQATGNSSTGNGGMGGHGGSGGCTQDGDCTGTFKPCYEYVCQSGACTENPLMQGTETPSQVYGDCRTSVCDGQGNIMVQDDFFDTFDDVSDCTVEFCSQGMTVHDPSIYGQPCVNGYCNDFGACVPCVTTANCGMGKVCDNETCVPSGCTNSTQDGMESAVDCGGLCVPCADGQPCIVNTDCKSKVCSGMNTCMAPTCTDGQKNGDEVGVDCGGPTCAQKCATDAPCTAHEDCASGVCVKAVCKAPTCTDGTKNGSETGVDCGGVCATCIP